GDARIAPAPKNAPIEKPLEGTWSGALDTQRGPVRLVVKMLNQPDGTAMGTIATPDEGGGEVPIAITGRASSVTIWIRSVGSSFVGVLNADNTELVGTWTERQATLPLTLRRAIAPGATKYKK